MERIDLLVRVMSLKATRSLFQTDLIKEGNDSQIQKMGDHN